MATGHGTKDLIYLEIRVSLWEKLSRWGLTSLKIIFIINDNYCHSIESVISFTWFESRLKETTVPTDCICPPRTYCWQPCCESQPNRRNNNGETTTREQKKKIKRKGTRTNTYCCIETLVGRLTIIQNSRRFHSFSYILQVHNIKPLLRALSQDPKFLA